MNWILVIFLSSSGLGGKSVTTIPIASEELCKAALEKVYRTNPAGLNDEFVQRQALCLQAK